MRKKIENLVNQLNKAREAYYNDNVEIMSNFEYDQLYDELQKLENETGIILENSPTQTVGYEMEIASSLKKEKHEIPALSLSKTKDKKELKEWLGNHLGILSWKLDGLTIQATYDNGKLIKALTRGNGEIGEIITHNARKMKGLPLEIPYKEHLVVRGEATIGYREFGRINLTIETEDDKYKNPRNLASGTVRALDSNLLNEREVIFNAFQIVAGAIKEKEKSFHSQLLYLSNWGFNVVSCTVVSENDLEENIDKWSADISLKEKNKMFNSLDIPVDGLVLEYDDTEYGDSLGKTGHHAKSGMAFKWADEEKETTIKEIFWSASKTGLINPVAIFEPIELEGTTVQRASIHNVSIAKELCCGTGAKVMVYKANMVIPQISKTLEKKELKIPKFCPVCNNPTTIKKGKTGSEFLYCENPNCDIKQVKQFVRFCERNAMNIEGISEATLEVFIENGYIHSFVDLYSLDKYKEEIINLEGFGEKSYQNMWDAIQKSKKVNVSNFLYSLGIPNFGKDATKTVAKMIGLKEFINRMENMQSLQDLEGIGEVIDNSVLEWRKNEKAYKEFKNLLQILEIREEIMENSSVKYKGMTFVITGSLNHYENRDALKKYIEENGGKVAGSVSSKTTYLINNDITSTSGKNKKAKELGIEIITEEMFLSFMNS